MSATPSPLPAATKIFFTKVVLFTASDGRACFREEFLPLDQGSPAARFSELFSNQGLQLRHSPVGFSSDFHCTTTAQWVFILQGQMEIELQDGSRRVFSPGEHFYSADTLPENAVFRADWHGHRSRQLGSLPLITAFVRFVHPTAP